ncbi:MAG: SusC/RagA family TonB-linked outer membrane protein [Candidatus Marinimicrobia bacterium]|nr:SusC/RagA family TonB-linked outer membrane protein [Candidatus Neomarinimicrobiota bacterium]
MRTLRTTSILIFVAAILHTGAMAQITGKVTDAQTGESLVGANIVVKGTFIGTTTDIEGKYRLLLPEESATLVVSYIGYKSEEVTVATQMEVVDISMETDALKLSEVVVIGLATSVKKRNLANAVATISGDELIPSPAQTLDDALSGKFAGVNIRRNTGAPGGGTNVNLRGISTIQGSTQPLYVVDGIIVNNMANQSGIDVVSKATGAGSATPQGQPTNRIGDINPNDIESIEVLKGASAAALYGAKASNGVIIITTKKGRGGKTKFSISHKIGQRTLVGKMGHRKFETYTEAKDQYGEDIAKLGLGNSSDTTSWLNRNIDYEEELYTSGSGDLVETTVSAAGGDERTQFYVSGQHQSEGGSIVNTGFERWSGRLNLNHRFSEKAKLTLTTNMIRVETDRGVTGNDNTNITYGFSIGFTPSFLDITQNDDGSWPDHPTNPSNPLHTARVFVNNEQTNRVMGSVQFNYSFLKIENMSLDWVTTAGVDFYAQRNKVFSPAELQYEKNVDGPGQSVNTTTNSLNTNLYTNLVHRMILPGNINLTSTAGLQYETLDWDQVFIHAKGMVVGQTNVDQASSADVFHTRRLQQDRGFFVQEEVNVNDQFHVAFGLRGDRSSTLGDTEKWFTYPKFSASYQAGALAGIFDDFKARLAWGQTGNLPSPTVKFTSLDPINIDGIGGLSTSGILGNEDIKPERTTEIEYGVDFSFLKGLGSVEFTLYQQTIEDLILEVDQAASSGATSQWLNAAEMETKGTEFSLLLNPIRSKNLNWMSRITYYKTESEITKLDVDPFNMGGFATFLGTYRIEKGWSPTSIIGSDTTASGGIKKLGDETPDFQMSFNNTIKLSSFTLQFLLDVKRGGDIINLANLIYDLGGTTADYDKMTLDPDKKTSNGPYRLSILGSQTAPYIEDGSYVKLREVSLFYDFGNEQVKKWFGGAVTSLRLGVSGRNLATWTDYTGLDPEVSQFGNVAIGGSVDTNPFPSSRSVYLLISMGF